MKGAEGRGVGKGVKKRGQKGDGEVGECGKGKTITLGERRHKGEEREREKEEVVE